LFVLEQDAEVFAGSPIITRTSRDGCALGLSESEVPELAVDNCESEAICQVARRKKSCKYPKPVDATVGTDNVSYQQTDRVRSWRVQANCFKGGSLNK
jgi:hypothetical protein